MIYMSGSYLHTVMTLKPLRMETQRQIQSCACAAQTLSPHRDISLLKAEGCGATVRSPEAERNEGGGGSIGNVFPALSGPSIALKCNKIICDSFDMKWQPVAGFDFQHPQYYPEGVKMLSVCSWKLRSLAFAPNRGYSFQSLRSISRGSFYLVPSCHWQRFSFFDWPTCVRGPEKEHIWRLLA